MNARILLIDDDPQLLGLMADAFTRAGFEAFSANDGAVGAKLARAHDPHLVVTDILMPEREGIEIIVEFKRAPRPPKVIAISGVSRLAGLDLLALATAVGADEIVNKPFRMSDLVELAERMLREDPLIGTCASEGVCEASAPPP
ncbi:response regulator transcription factor [Phenylobacterium sp.]|uniref:response regulator transcription factor n=1 Tax=Phenylobacterium sp. TaxID=1871053 RepID=UPI0035642515